MPWWRLKPESATKAFKAGKGQSWKASNILKRNKFHYRLSKICLTNLCFSNTGWVTTEPPKLLKMLRALHCRLLLSSRRSGRSCPWRTDRGSMSDHAKCTWTHVRVLVNNDNRHEIRKLLKLLQESRGPPPPYFLLQFSVFHTNLIYIYIQCSTAITNSLGLKKKFVIEALRYRNLVDFDQQKSIDRKHGERCVLYCLPPSLACTGARTLQILFI